MGRFRRSFRLAKESWTALMKDKELMLLPILSGLALLVLVASFAVPVFAVGGSDLEDMPQWATYLALFVFYVLAYTITFFFQAAVIAGALQRMQGGDPTLGSALAAARQRLGALFLWGIVAATVGLIIRSIEERSEMVGRIAMALLGAAWSLATFFMVPVLVMERRSLRESFKRSWGIVKETWGETIIGSMGLGLVGFLVSLPFVALVGWMVSAGMVLPAVVVGLITLGGIAVLFSALQGVYTAAVYRYATAGDVPPSFDAETLRGAFRPKG